MPESGTPRPGSIYAVPFSNGQYGACLLIRRMDSGWYIAGLEGFWGRVPPIKVFKKRKLYRQEPFIFEGASGFQGYIEKDPPGEFVSVGTVQLTRTEEQLELPCTMFECWDDISNHLFREWRKLHDRAALESEDAGGKEEREKEDAERERKKRARRAKLTLPDLAKLRPFDDWTDMWSGAISKKANAIYKSCIDSLLKNAPPREAIHEMVLAFNRLEEEHECIETVEREQIIEQIAEIAEVIGLEDDPEDLAGDRDW